MPYLPINERMAGCQSCVGEYTDMPSGVIPASGVGPIGSVGSALSDAQHPALIGLGAYLGYRRAKKKRSGVVTSAVVGGVLGHVANGLIDLVRFGRGNFFGKDIGPSVPKM